MIITPRVTFGGNHWLADYLKDARRKGVKLIYETDDDLWSEDFPKRQMALIDPAITRAEKRRTLEIYELQRKQRIKLLNIYNGMTVTSTHLASHVPVPMNVQVVPNMIDVELFQHYASKRDRFIDGLTIGWAGGSRLDEDFDSVGFAWARVARRHPEVTFILYGTEPEVLMRDIPDSQLAVIEWADIRQYPAGLKNFDIGCCILSSTPWNKSKSPIKWFENSVAGVPCVVSPTVYGEVVTHGHDALVALSVDEWEESLEKLLESPRLRAEMAMNAYLTVVNNYNLSNRYSNWLNAWQRIVEA